MTQLNPKQIISECNLDSGIIEYLFRLKNGSINKQHGKPNALYVLKMKNYQRLN